MRINDTVMNHLTPLEGYPHVHCDASLKDVFATLKARYDSAEQFRSVLVLDDEEHLVGVLGLRDLLHALLPGYLREHPKHFDGSDMDVSSLAALWQEDCSEQCRKAASRRAGDYVPAGSLTVEAGDPLVKAIYLFATRQVNVLPVTEGKRVTGVLRIVDVLTEVASVVLSDGEA